MQAVSDPPLCPRGETEISAACEAAVPSAILGEDTINFIGYAYESSTLVLGTSRGGAVPPYPTTFTVQCTKCAGALLKRSSLVRLQGAVLSKTEGRQMVGCAELEPQSTLLRGTGANPVPSATLAIAQVAERLPVKQRVRVQVSLANPSNADVL